MPTTTRTVYLTDENGNALIDAHGNMRTLSFSPAQGYSYRLVERASIVSATYAQVVGYSTANGQTITGVENASEFDVGDFGIVQYAVSDRNNTIGYVTCEVTAVGTDSLTVNGIGISVAGADGQVTKEAIAEALGLTTAQIEQVVALSKILTVTADKVQIAADVEASSFIVLYLDDDFTYTTNESGVTITGLSEAGATKLAASGGNLVIPPMIDSQNVVAIADRAFLGKDILKSVTIGNGVEWIGTNAFWGCSGLTSVTIPDSVTSILDGAFWSCTSLTSVIIPDSVTGLGSDAFNNCTGLTSVTIGNSVPLIRNRAFSDCTSLKSVTIPNSVTTILNQAFENCTSLTSVTIPDSVTSIGANAFYGCNSLTTINIGNASIGNNAFYGCTKLTSTIIGKGVANIGNFAFKNCTGLASFAYEGTVAEWASVSKRIDWNAGCPFTVVHCSDGDVDV